MGASWTGQPGDVGSDPTPLNFLLLLTLVQFTQQQSGSMGTAITSLCLWDGDRSWDLLGRWHIPSGAPSGRNVVPPTACHSPVGWEHTSGCWISAQHSQIHASPLATVSQRAPAAALANYLTDFLIPSKPSKALLLLGTLPASWSRQQDGGRQRSLSPG